MSKLSEMGQMFSRNCARDYVEERLIAPFFRKNPKYIGIELEYPILFLDDSIDSKAIGIEFLNALIATQEFSEEKGTYSAEIMRVNHSCGDSISYDYSYATIEFSMARGINIDELAQRFYSYFKIANDFYKSKGCIISGMGTNPMLPKIIKYTDSKYTNSLRDFISKYTVQKDPKYYLLNMQSVQTHIDVEGKRLTRLFNTLCKLDFVRALLFSNSLPSTDNLPTGVEYDAGTLCARDVNWEKSGFPNTGLCDCDLANIEELIDYFTDKKLCFVRDGVDFNCFKPTSLTEYFDSQKHPEKDIECYFNVERVTINLLNVVEVRGDCIQPLNATFAPSAFSIGISNNVEKAYHLCSEFLKENALHAMGNKQLRLMAVTGRFNELCMPITLVAFLTKMIDTAKQGLIQRGFGEEKHLKPLYERAKKLLTPAEHQLQMMAEGKSILQIAQQYAEIK